MDRRVTFSAAAVGVLAGSILVPVASAQAAVTCTLSASVTAVAAVESADLTWAVTATDCVATPDVEIEVHDQASPSDPAGIVLTGLAVSGSQSVSPLVGGHTYDVTLTALADGEGAQDATTVVPLTAPAPDRAETVTLKLSADDVPLGAAVNLHGVAKTLGGDVTPDRRVTAQFKAAGETEWAKVDADRTDGAGHYGFVDTPKGNGKYRVLVDDATSASSAVEVDRKVVAKFGDPRVDRRDTARLRVSLKAAAPSTKVQLAVKTRNGWDDLRTKVSKRGRVTFKMTARDDNTYRVTAKETAKFGAGSDTVTLHVAGR